jgi:hypothetical protein
MIANMRTFLYGESPIAYHHSLSDHHLIHPSEFRASWVRSLPGKPEISACEASPFGGSRFISGTTRFELQMFESFSEGIPPEA